MKKINDTDRYPLYFFDLKTKTIRKCQRKPFYNSWELNFHHYIKKTKYDKNPSKYTGTQQKLILLPVKMHQELEHGGISDQKFFERYGITRDELLYR